jgi:hypothetical protein
MDTTASSGPITDGVVVYDTDTGKFFFTGSYGGSAASFSTAGTNIVSSSAFSSPSQGQLSASINGVGTLVDLGLMADDSPTFNNLTTTNNITIGGNLTVNGTTSTISTTNMLVEDTFILLGSGSADGGLNDGGIIVEQSADGTGTALFWDTSAQNWAIDLAGASPSSNTAANDVNVVTVQLNANSSNTPTTNPLMGNDDNTDKKGHFYVDTDDAFGLYVYL